MATMKIYRIEICVSHDSCSEFWENYPLTDFISNKAKAEKELERCKKLTPNEITHLTYAGYASDNRPTLETYDLITDEC